MGAGLGRRLAEVRWSLATRMFMAWVVTLPAAAGLAALVTQGADSIGGNAGSLFMAAVAAVAAGLIWALALRNRINASNVNEPWDDAPPTSIRPQPTAAARSSGMSDYIDVDALWKVCS